MALAQWPSAEHAAEVDAWQPGQPAGTEPALIVFSGGTAFNSVAAQLRHLTTRVVHVLPVSDDGGSTAEIVRVLGGPAVGDIRSRCLRLADDSDEEALAVRRLLAYRLPSSSAADAKQEWYQIVEGEHALWEGVSDPYKHTIRAFLVHFHANIMRHSSERFSFRSGSVGNFFFAGARIFFRSLEAAIFLFSRVARIPEGSLVLPAVCTEERISLAAELADGTLVLGQNEISHPSSACSPAEVDKSTDCYEALPAAVRRVFYLASEGDHTEHEVAPAPNARILEALGRADAIVYGMGSFYTSICPSLILRGVGEAVAARACPKIFILNGAIDREVSACAAHAGPMTAADMVEALADALNRRHARKVAQLAHPPAAYVTTIIAPEGGPVEVDERRLAELGVLCVLRVPTLALGAAGGAGSSSAGLAAYYDPDRLVDAIQAALPAMQPS